MSTTTTEIKLSIAYQDATSRSLTFKNVTSQAQLQIASKVQALNANPSAAFQTTFRSINNAPATGIGKAQIVTTEEEVIYEN